MTQYKAIPQATDQRNQSQIDILNNFNYLNSQSVAPNNGIILVDHLATGDNGTSTSDGFHKQVSLLNRATPANLTNAVNAQASNGIVYSQNDSVGNAQLHFYNGINDFQLSPFFPMRIAVNFSTTGANGAQTINGTSFNVANVTRTSQGMYTVNFTNATPSNNYYLTVTGMGTAATLTLWGGLQGAATYATSATTLLVKLAFFNTNGPQDPVSASVLLFGG
jgi:hypothetical protein